MMDPIKHRAAYERMDVLQQLAAEIRIAKSLSGTTPATTPAPTPAIQATPQRPSPAVRRERCPDDLAQPRPA